MDKTLFSNFLAQKTRKIGTLLTERGGNVAMIFGLSAVVVVGAVGGGIDFARVQTERSRIQEASDAAVLRATSLTSLTESEQQVAADRTFDSNMSGGNTTITSRNLERVTSGNRTDLTYTVMGDVKPIFLGLMGIDNLPITVVSMAQAQLRKSEIVMVLDITASMNQNNRMTHLKNSVGAVLNELDSGTGNVSGTMVGIVPFNTLVRIEKGTNYKYINYGEATGSQTCASGVKGCSLVMEVYNKVCYHAADPLSCKTNSKLFYRTYTEDGKSYTEAKAVAKEGNKSYVSTVRYYTEQAWSNGGTSCNTETGVCTTTQPGYTTRNVVDQTGAVVTTNNLDNYNKAYPGDAYNQTHIRDTYGTGNGYGATEAKVVKGTSRSVPTITHLPAVVDRKSDWLGCINDRNQPYDVSAESPSIEKPDSLYRAVGCENSKMPYVLGLTDDIAKVKTHMNTLTPMGYTNITIGVQWGMEVLSAGAPMEGGVEWHDRATEKYMILVTDGENTRSRFTSTPTEIDKRTKMACETARAQGITIFVVRVMEGNTTLLRECATKPEFFYDLKSADQLGQALVDVFNAMKKTRLTQ
ncbi:MAG: VWA domain-containing protein [Asticcacaulis sp.]